MNDNDRVKLARQMAEAKEELPRMIEAIQIQAELTRARYLALIKQGFTAQEALEICKAAL